MSLEAKLHLAKRLEKELGQTLPAATVEEVIAKVSEILGHDNLNTTMTYVYLDQSAVKNSYHKYSA